MRKNNMDAETPPGENRCFSSSSESSTVQLPSLEQKSTNTALRWSTAVHAQFQSLVVKYFRGLTDDFLAQDQPTARKTKCQNKALFSTFFLSKTDPMFVCFLKQTCYFVCSKRWDRLKCWWWGVQALTWTFSSSQTCHLSGSLQLQWYSV